MDDVPGAQAPFERRPLARFGPWLALALAGPLTPATCRRLQAAFPDPARLFGALSDAVGTDRSVARRARLALTAPQGPLTPAHVAALDGSLTRRRVVETLDWWTADSRRHLVPIDDPSYPPLLRGILDPPPLLYLEGDPAALAGPSVAVVGSRDASQAGLEQAQALARDLAASGLVVVSGLALGTDGAAHAGALDGSLPDGGPPTLAFTGTGPDIVYPRRHRRLAAAVLERGGAIASEFPLRHPPQPWCFPQRNRLISGASLGVVVIEAALPSGTLTTARHALDEGREVMAVPGAVDNPRSAGCHALIRDGAALVTSAADVLRVLAVPLRRALEDDTSARPRPTTARTVMPASARTRDGDTTSERVWTALDAGSATLERLVSRSGLDVPALLAALGALELAGRVVVERDGRYARCTDDRGRAVP